MKRLIMFATMALASLSTVYADRDWDRGGRDYDRGDYRYVRERDYGRSDYRHDDHRGYRRPMSLEARAQLRLRQLGFYYGSIDGDFGYGSRRALYRFQHSRHLPMTGYLDWRTRRALGI